MVTAVVTVEFLCENILDEAESETDAKNRIMKLLSDASICDFGEEKVLKIEIKQQ